MKLNTWIKNLILEFRKEYQNLPKDIQKGIYNLINFTPPCQVNVLWIQNSQLNIDFQFFFFTKWKEQKDLDIIVNGPIESRFIKKAFTDFIQDRKWIREYLTKKRPYRKEHVRTYSDRIADIFSRALKLIEMYAKYFYYKPDSRKETYFSHKAPIASADFYWFSVGKAQDLNINTIVGEFINEIKNRTKPKMKTLPKKEEYSLNAFGSYFYPPIWIGTIPKLSVEEKVFGGSIWPYAHKTFSTAYKGNTIVLTKDGFIAICQENKADAIDMLNEIMATALFYNVESRAIRPMEIFENKVDMKTHSITSFQVSPSSPRTQLLDKIMQNSFSTDTFEYERTIIQKKKILDVIKRAEIITQYGELSNFLKFALESHTYYRNSEYAQSLIMSWLILENFIKRKLLEMIQSKGISGDRKGKLKNTLSWTTDHRLELLNISGKIVDCEYEKLMALKGIRNGIVHRGKKCSANDARKCLEMALQKVRVLINKALKEVSSA